MNWSTGSGENLMDSSLKLSVYRETLWWIWKYCSAMLTSTGNHLLPVNASPARLSCLQGNKGCVCVCVFLCKCVCVCWGIRTGYCLDGRGCRRGTKRSCTVGGGEVLEGTSLPGKCCPLLANVKVAVTFYRQFEALDVLGPEAKFVFFKKSLFWFKLYKSLIWEGSKRSPTGITGLVEDK